MGLYLNARMGLRPLLMQRTQITDKPIIFRWVFVIHIKACQSHQVMDILKVPDEKCEFPLFRNPS